jgi:hypothetical protein
MTQVVMEREGWTEHVATHVDPQTKAALFERAYEETSVSSVLRRAVAAYLEQADEKEEEL